MAPRIEDFAPPAPDEVVGFVSEGVSNLLDIVVAPFRAIGNAAEGAIDQIKRFPR